MTRIETGDKIVFVLIAAYIAGAFCLVTYSIEHQSQLHNFVPICEPCSEKIKKHIDGLAPLR